MMNRPICVNCKHHFKGYLEHMRGEWENDKHWCSHAKDIVTGGTSRMPCRINRLRSIELDNGTYDSCGPEGRFYESKEKMTNTNYHSPACSKAIGLPCDCGTEHNVGHMFKGPVPPGADNVIVGTYKCMGRDCTGYIMESTDIDYTTNVSSNAVGRTYFRVKT